MRIFVIILALASLVCRFLRDIDLSFPWDIIIIQIVPGLVLFLIWAIPFDMLMARVFMTDKPAAERSRYKAIILIDLIIWLLLVVIWGQVFIKLISGR
jgi:hypothetical protein